MTRDSSTHSILSGVRILEIGHFVAAPFCTRLLGDLGADIIKVEPLSGDPVRNWGEMVDGRSVWWSMHARNKRCISLNLKAPEAKQIVLDLVKTCDALVENFRPGQLTKLGFSPEVLRQTNPSLIVASISGFGQDGPYRDRAAFGLIGEAMGGLRYLTNHSPSESDLPPVRVGVSIGDSIAGLYAAFGVAAALWRRDTSGATEGATIDVALSESVLSMMEGMLPEFGALGAVKQPMGGGLATAAPSDAYPTKDGAWVLIGANSEPLFAKLATLMDRSDLINAPGFGSNSARVENRTVLNDLIASWTRTLAADELVDLLTDSDIPNCKAYTAAECASDPQYLARGMVQRVQDSRFPEPVLQAGIVPRFTEEPGSVRWPGPDIGEHNQDVYQKQLGYTNDRLAELRKKGVI